MSDLTEIIPDKLWQSKRPTEDILNQVKPSQIVNCCWFEDKELPDDMPRLSKTADAIAVLIHSGERVLIHCEAGINRSSLMTCLVLLRLNRGWSGAQTLKFLEDKRPGIFTNQTFRKFVMELDAQHDRTYREMAT